MSGEEKLNRMACNSCNMIFDITDAAIKLRKYGGIQIREKRCPKCGGTFKAVYLPDDLDKYLYVNDNKYYYSYSKGEN